jgi:hypothetical protein
MSVSEVKSEDSRGQLASLVARIDLDDLAHRLATSLSAHPEYGRFMRVPAEAVAIYRWNIELFVRWLVEGREPSEADLEVLRQIARERAVQGMAPELLIRASRDGVRFGWNVLLENAAADERAALIDIADVFFRHVEVISDVIADTYASQRNRLDSGQELRSRALALMTALVAPSPLGPEQQQLAETLEFSLVPELIPFAAAIEGGTSRDHAALTTVLLRRGVLAVSEVIHVVGVAGEESQLDPLRRRDDVITALDGPTVRGQLAVALEDLRAALPIAKRSGRSGFVGPDDLLPDLLLARSAHLSERIERKVFGRLQEGEHDELIRTLEELVEHSFDRGASAAALPVHRNTITYRLERIQELTGLELNDPDVQALIWLAARYRRARRDAS